jgi:lactoylglutathione lyase
MTSMLRKAFGYQGNAMDLPVRDLDASIPFYETVFGFQTLSQSDGPPRAAVLGRDDVQIGLAENGRDPGQDGCAFHVEGVDALHAAFAAAGLRTGLGEIGAERQDQIEWRRFFVVAPDGLCYWFGERQA